MANANSKEEMFLQNLIDAGCDECLVKDCIDLAENQAYVKMLPRLQEFRIKLLDTIHTDQDRLNCLDYLIYQIKNNNI